MSFCKNNDDELRKVDLWKKKQILLHDTAWNRFKSVEIT